MSATLAHAVFHFVVGKHGAQCGAPVHPSLAQVRETETQQDLLLVLLAEARPFGVCECRHRIQLFVAGDRTVVVAIPTVLLETLHQFADGLCFLRGMIVPTIEELEEDPLRPFVVGRITGAHFAAPIETESDVVQLFAVTRDVDFSGLRRVLTGLDGILLRRQAEAVVAHGVQHVEAFLALVARNDVAGDVAQRMPYMQARSARVREHVEHIVLRFARVVLHAVGAALAPFLAPLPLYVLVLVAHCGAKVEVGLSVVGCLMLVVWHTGTCMRQLYASAARPPTSRGETQLTTGN